MLNMNIEKLGNGWVDLELIIDGQSMLIVFEYTPNDALADILASSIQLLSHKDNFTITFPNGSEKQMLNVKKTECNTCKVSIGEFSEQLSMKQYVRAVLGLFDRFIYAHSIEQYAEGWRRSFPQKELEMLRASYRSL